MNPLVSVIVTTKNEATNITTCLQSLTAQTYPQLEIIVVDNHSTDQTKTLAQKYTPLVFTHGPERSAQRNFGILQKSHGHYVIFIDADMILSPALIAACVSYAQKTKSDALWLSEVILGKNFFSQCRRFERSFYDGTPIDGVRFIKKQAFAAVKGFDPQLSGPEDWDLDKKLATAGYKLALLPHGHSSKTTTWPLASFITSRGVNPRLYGHVIYHNEADFHLQKYLHKKRYYVKSFHAYINKWGKNDPDLKKQLGFYYRYFGVFWGRGKWRRLLAHPLLTLGMYYLRFLVGLNFLRSKLS